tara:strand:- start:793 stop:1104 length:312 start_codon:yes stop_codon:yes gene_type:complete
MIKEYKKIIYIDIDETICETPSNRDYTQSSPIKKNIKKANSLYESGNKIVYWTARGTISGEDWRDVTVKQFEEWGVKYHDLKFGKPYYDLFIDDKNMNAKDWE